MTASNAFVDPSALSLPSPRSDASSESPRSPPETLPGPSRKRQRTELSQEERKEARAHRNRIAAQNSRDKRKAQFGALERRVAELEEENRQLRAGMSAPDLERADDRRKEDRQREKARELENAELRERVKSLEKGWEAVMKVLAAQGLPATVVPSAPAQTPSTPLPACSSSSPPSSPTNSPTTFPVLVPTTPAFPLTPSPSISSSSLFGPESDVESESQSTRHLARVATATAHHAEAPLQRLEPTVTSPTFSASSATSEVTALDLSVQPSAADESAMEDWIREILAASPSLSSATLPSCDEPTIESTPSSGAATLIEPRQTASLVTLGTQADGDVSGSGSGSEKRSALETGWADEAEMQRLLDLLPVVQPAEAFLDVDFDMVEPTASTCGEWDLSAQGPSSSSVGVF